jgi:hypothetical protein
MNQPGDKLRPKRGRPVPCARFSSLKST